MAINLQSLRVPVSWQIGRLITLLTWNRGIPDNALICQEGRKPPTKLGPTSLSHQWGPHSYFQILRAWPNQLLSSSIESDAAHHSQTVTQHLPTDPVGVATEPAPLWGEDPKNLKRVQRYPGYWGPAAVSCEQQNGDQA
ncbi:Hypothetical predicted protein [Pelobates cultripes]|uniref:Uncharacterized protein n=1 Tax=Pelobates cultripes TaxID=61616 RepID=A0AAD1VRF8_PELCU|nr:Hypothetical predicted protein [Pelobates cultripes]